MVVFIIIFSSFMLCPFFLIAYSMLEIFARKETAVFLLTGGSILFIRLSVFLFTVIAATLAVAGVHCPTFANKLMTSMLLCTLCCKYKRYGYIQIEHNDLHV